MGFTLVQGDHNLSTVFFVYQAQNRNKIPETGEGFQAGENTLTFGIVMGVEDLLEKARIRFFKKLHAK